MNGTKPDSDKVCYTVTEVAALLHISVRHVWSLLKDKKFPEPIRLGKCVRWRRIDVDKVLRGEWMP
mgnify:FL=1